MTKQFTITATNAAGSSTATIDLATCDIPWTWVANTGATTVDLKALYPNATGFYIAAIGGGGGGNAGFSRSTLTQSIYGQYGGAGGGAAAGTILAANVTGPITFNVGAGGAGGIPANGAAGTLAPTTGPVAGQASTVVMGGTTIMSAGGGGATVAAGNVRPAAAVSSINMTKFVSGGATASIQPPANVVSANAANYTVVSGQNGGGGAAGGSAGTSATSVWNAGFGQGQTVTTATAPGLSSATAGANAGSATNGATPTQDTLPTSAGLKPGAGGGGGGVATNTGSRGGNGGNGGYPGGGGGGGGNGTYGAALVGLPVGGNGGNGANGLIGYFPIY